MRILQNSMSEQRDGLTIILPCAGAGARLGLDTPKELFEIRPGIRLIDFSLAHIRAAVDYLSAAHIMPTVAVVVRPWKKAVTRYVSSRLHNIDVREVFFDEQLEEWPGSVHSARLHYSRFNIVLLPDSVIYISKSNALFDPSGNCLISLIIDKLRRYPVVFGTVACEDSRRLTSLGAVHVDSGGIIDRFRDKPTQHLEKYNAFWACYAFDSLSGGVLYPFLIQSVQRKRVDITSQKFSPVASEPVFAYQDLGTWEAIRRFRAGGMPFAIPV